MKVFKVFKITPLGEKGKFWGQREANETCLSIPWLNKRPSQIAGGVLEECAHKHTLFFECNLDRYILKPRSLSTHPPPGLLPSLWATSPEAPLKATPLIITCKGTDTWTCIKQTFLPAKNTWWRKISYNPIKCFLIFEPSRCAVTEIITTCISTTQVCVTAKNKNVGCMLCVWHFLIIKDQFHSIILEDELFVLSMEN